MKYQMNFRSDFSLLQKMVVCDQTLSFIITIIIIIIILVTFMQGIYNYVSETNHVCRVCSVAAVLYLQFVPRVMLYRTWNCVLFFYISTFCSICAVPNMAFFWGGGGSSLIFFFTSTLLRNWLTDFEMVPFASIMTGVAFAFTFHLHFISIMRSLYFKILFS
jgi:hypothetical protein